jgi:RNA polymerase sigma-70 factor (ECF subfamily)
VVKFEPAAEGRCRGDDGVRGDVELLANLKAGNLRAQTLVFDRYHRDVRRIVMRILGTTPDVADAMQDTFLRVFKNAGQIKDAMALRGWLLRVAVTVALDQLRHRQRLRWLVFANDEVHYAAVEGASAELRSALRDTYTVLDKLPNEERVAFALRHIEGMELEEMAQACGVSLSTAKRRLSKAEGRFRTLAKRHPGLADWTSEEDAQ